MKTEKQINYKLEVSKRINASGKSEVMIRFDVSRTNRPTLRSGVFVSSSIEAVKDNGSYVLYTEDKNLLKEVKTANALLTIVEDKISNIISVTIDAKNSGRYDGEIDRDYIERVLALPDIDENSSFNAINEAIELQERLQREEEEREARKEQARNRITIYQYINMYCEKERLSKGRIRMYRAFARSLMRFELYKVQVLSQKEFVVDVDSLTSEDVEEFRKYLLEEFELVNRFPTLFASICATVDASIPVTASKKILPRSNNYIIDVMTKFRSIYNWLLDTDKTHNNPFKGIKKGSAVYGTPIYLTEEERDHLATFPLINDKVNEEGTIKEDKRGRKLDLIRDVFIFQCLVGARYGDLSRFTEEDNIDDDVLMYYPSKTRKHEKQEPVIVPLDDDALALIKKYRGADPDGRLLPFPPASTFNENLKTVFERCGINRKVVVLNPLTGKEETKPISEVVASHMARRTFAGNLWNEIKDPTIVCSMTGHVEGSKAFSRYRKVDLDVKREAIKLLHKNKTQESKE